jgi:hypothetical protein
VHLRRILSLASLALLASVSGLAAQRPTPGAAAPAAAVERLLRLSEARSYREMGQVFGTADGPVSGQWPSAEVEQRMYAIASILEHDRFVIRNERPVPGRLGAAMVLTVEIVKGSKSTQVPFTVVRNGERWLVEQIELERLTRAE